MADVVAKRKRHLSGPNKASAAAAIGEQKMNGDHHMNFNTTLFGPSAAGNFVGGYVEGEEQSHWREGRSGGDMMSVFSANHHVVQNYHPQEQQQQPPPVVGGAGGFTYQTPPTPTLMAVLGPPKQTLLTSESGLDALERRLLAEVVGNSRKQLEPWDYNNNQEEDVENGGTGYGMKTKRDQLGRRDVRGNVLLSTGGAAGRFSNGNQRLPPIDTDLDLDLDLVRGEGVSSGGSGGRNGVSAPIAIPMKSPDPLNESCISSLTLGGEGLVSALPDIGPSNGGGAAFAAAGDSDGEGEGEVEFDGRTHRAGSASVSGGSNSSSDGMVPGALGGGGGGFHKHMRQRAEVSTPTEMIPQQQRGKSRREGSGRGSGGDGKERVKSSSSKKKERLTGTGSKGTSEPKKSRNKSSAAAKGRVAAWLGGIDPAVPPQEEIIPPSPSVIMDSDKLSFEDEQRAVLGSSPLAAAAPLLPLRPDFDSPTTPGGALAFNALRSDFAADIEINMDQDNVLSDPPSSGFVPITTLNRNTIGRRPLLLGRDTTVIDETTRRTQELWSSTPPGITLLDRDTLKPGGATGAVSLLPHEKIIRKPLPSSSISKPASAIPLSYSAVVTSTPSAPGSSSGATPRNLWRNFDPTLSSTSQPNDRHALPPSTTKPPGYNPSSSGKLPMFPPTNKTTPFNPEVKYDIRSASRGGRGGKVSSVASLWAPGSINNHRLNHHQTTAAATATTAAATTTGSHSNVKDRDKGKEVPKRLFNDVEEASDPLPSSSSSALVSKPVAVKTKKKLFSAAVKTPAPALKKNVRTHTSPPTASGGGGRGESSSTPKKMVSTPVLLPVRSGDGLGVSTAARGSIDNLPVERPTPTAITMKNVLQGGKSTPSANLSTSSSGKLHELTTTKRSAAVNGPPGVTIKATSDPAVISSSHAVPTLSSTASLVRPQNSTDRKQDYYRHHIQPNRVAVVKLPPSTRPGTGGVGSGGVGAAAARSGPTVSSQQQLPSGSQPQLQTTVVENNSSNPRKPAGELAFGQASLRDLIKKYQTPSPADGGQKM